MSGVPFSVIDAMCNGRAVDRPLAEKVLKAFSQYTHSRWTLDNVDVSLLTTSGGKERDHEA